LKVKVFEQPWEDPIETFEAKIQMWLEHMKQTRGEVEIKHSQTVSMQESFLMVLFYTENWR
jgi:hypothetical protein